VFVEIGISNDFHFVKEPDNETAQINVSVSIPCEVNRGIRFRYWIINGSNYTLGNLPPETQTNMNKDGIFSLVIPTASQKWNGTTFQCVIVDGNMDQSSRIGLPSLSKFASRDLIFISDLSGISLKH